MISETSRSLFHLTGGQSSGLGTLPCPARLRSGDQIVAGALRIGGATDSYYSVAAASIGYQIGVQSTSHALFFMTEEALQKFRRSEGWELGADAEFTVPGDGISLNLDSTTIKSPVIAVIYAQDGLLAGASLEGAKYSRIIR